MTELGPQPVAVNDAHNTMKPTFSPQQLVYTTDGSASETEESTSLQSLKEQLNRLQVMIENIEREQHSHGTGLSGGLVPTSLQTTTITSLTTETDAHVNKDGKPTGNDFGLNFHNPEKVNNTNMSTKEHIFIAGGYPTPTTKQTSQTTEITIISTEREQTEVPTPNHIITIRQREESVPSGTNFKQVAIKQFKQHEIHFKT